MRDIFLARVGPTTTAIATALTDCGTKQDTVL